MPPAMQATAKATFGFVYDGTTETFSGSYHDKAAGIDLTGQWRAEARAGGSKGQGGCLAGRPDLDGNGASADDLIDMPMAIGPVAGYHNTGSPSGNITVTMP